ncbi:MAG TPA: YajG family lipoprotein [Gammaproteobacteria bacterium]|nr:YajG family lipoprotein [Gammaproteobacteria bacterium]
MMRKPAAGWLLFLMAMCGLAACALSPQTVDIAPSISVNPETIGHERRVALSVIDARVRPVLGTRGGVYGDTATLSPSGDITAGVRKAVAEALVTKGFKIADAPPADLSMRIEVNDVGYAGKGAPVVRKVGTAAKVSVIASREGREYTSHAAVTQSKEVLEAPDVAENQTLINTTLSKALEKLLNDPGLMDFLR